MIHLGDRPAPFGVNDCGRPIAATEQISTRLEDVDCRDCLRLAAARILTTGKPR